MTRGPTDLPSARERFVALVAAHGDGVDLARAALLVAEEADPAVDVEIELARPETLACCERILVMVPDAPGELRDRGLVLHRLECFGAAERDLERFLSLAPSDPSADAVREILAEVRTQASRVS